MQGGGTAPCCLRSDRRRSCAGEIHRSAVDGDEIHSEGSTVDHRRSFGDVRLCAVALKAERPPTDDMAKAKKGAAKGKKSKAAVRLSEIHLHSHCAR